ncbi:MAG TPA: hypothetical protein ACFE0H_06670 [Elainellaceae cyanobacterium]|jgi:uncharacterized membrane protein
MIRWHTFFLKISVWLVAEVVLSVMGLDLLADYSEFLANHTHTASIYPADIPTCLFNI